MAQGGGKKSKVKAPPRRKEHRVGLAAAKGSRRKNAPVKQKRHKRDPQVTKMLHKNIERLMAAKALRNEGSLRIKSLEKIGKEQLEIENQSKKKRKRTKEEAEEQTLQKQQKRYE